MLDVVAITWRMPQRFVTSAERCCFCIAIKIHAIMLKLIRPVCAYIELTLWLFAQKLTARQAISGVKK